MMSVCVFHNNSHISKSDDRTSYSILLIGGTYMPIPAAQGQGCASGLRLETGQDKALKVAGVEYVCTCGILGVWICSHCS